MLPSLEAVDYNALISFKDRGASASRLSKYQHGSLFRRSKYSARCRDFNLFTRSYKSTYPVLHILSWPSTKCACASVSQYFSLFRYSAILVQVHRAHVFFIEIEASLAEAAYRTGDLNEWSFIVSRRPAGVRTRLLSCLYYDFSIPRYGNSM